MALTTFFYVFAKWTSCQSVAKNNKNLSRITISAKVIFWRPKCIILDQCLDLFASKIDQKTKDREEKSEDREDEREDNETFME